MLKQEVAYTDFNDEEQVVTLYFNLNEAELIRLNAQYEGGIENYVKDLDPDRNPQDALTLFELFEDVVLMAYGKKSEDGQRFIKDDNIKTEFVESAAYASMLMDLLQSPEKAIDFFNQILSRTSVGPLPEPNSN